MPGTKFLAFLTSYPMPYVMAAGLLFLACYLIYKAVRGCLDPIGARFETPPQIFQNVLGVFGLIAGMSLLARIPRLARENGVGGSWRSSSLHLFTSLYLRVFPENRYSIERFVSQTQGTTRFTTTTIVCLFWALVAGTAAGGAGQGTAPCPADARAGLAL